MSNKVKPRPPGSDEVCVGIPVGLYYPAAPPRSTPTSGSSGGTRAAAPPRPRTSSNGGAATHFASESYVDTINCKHRAVDCIVYIAFFFAFSFILFMYHGWPTFKVEAVTVFVENSNSSSSDATLRWNIGFSIYDGSSIGDFDYHDLNVYFRYVSEDWSRAVVRSTNYDPKNLASLNAIVNTSLPDYNSGNPHLRELMLEFEVMIRVNFVEKTTKAICKGMTVGLPPNAIGGVMQGGPRLCHVDSFLKNRFS